jgi:hypothetical protein
LSIKTPNLMTTIIRFCLVALLFVYANSNAKTHTTNSNYANSTIQRVRIDFTMPDGYIRHLLLAFTSDNSASDSYDYGYDALNQDAYPYDLNWLVDNQRCVIQGVGAFDNSKKYPFWMFMSKDGAIEIALKALENFDTPIDLFIYDSKLDTYTQINDSNYASSISKGDYVDRFYLAFKDESQADEFADKSLSADAFNLENTKVNYLRNTKELYVNTHNNFIIETINIYNLLGQEIYSLNHVNSKLVKIPLEIKQNKYGIVILKTDEGESLSKKIALN